MVEVTDLLIHTTESEAKLWGCFCTRYIQDNDIDSVLKKAKALVLSQLREEGILCVENQILIESVKEVDKLPGTAVDKGFTFYPIDEPKRH